MEESLRLGRVAGVNVGINWSVLVIFLLLTVGLAAGRFPALYPDLPVASYVVAGLVAGLIFLASLLAHEVAHAVVARRNGVEVEGITLWMFGGVARLHGEAADPGADFRIAGVGPLVSLVLAGLFGGVALVLDAFAEGLVVGIFWWLALINLVLAVFNMMPAAPLDGGRVLRSYLWRRSGDRYEASMTAARAGRGFGWFLVALGFLQFVAGAGLAGLWLVLIGWFLTTIARAEEEHARVSGALSGVRVRDVMSADPVSVSPDLVVDRFVEEYVFPNRFSSFPLVGSDGRPAGLVTLNRVKGLAPEERGITRVEDLACPIDDVAVVGPDRPAADVLTEMSRCPDGRALVVEDGRLVGIVSPVDIMRHLELGELRNQRDRAHI
ncbi:MAG: site-2 protease family protein [Acidimicrobiia bacterium]